MDNSEIMAAVIGLIGVFVGAFLQPLINLFLYEVKNLNNLKLVEYSLKHSLDFHNQLSKYIKDSRNQTVDGLQDWQKIHQYEINCNLPQVEFGAISFLVKKDENLLNYIVICMREIESVQNVLQKRNELFSEYQDKTKTIEEKNSEEFLKNQDPKLLDHLKFWTKNLEESNENAIEDHKKAIEQLKTFVQKFSKKTYFFWGAGICMLATLALMVICKINSVIFYSCNFCNGCMKWLIGIWLICATFFQKFWDCFISCA